VSTPAGKTTRRGHITKAGNRAVRTALVEALLADLGTAAA
jgi:transposase